MLIDKRPLKYAAFQKLFTVTKDQDKEIMMVEAAVYIVTMLICLTTHSIEVVYKMNTLKFKTLRFNMIYYENRSIC